MIDIKKGNPPQQDDLNARQKDIRKAINMEIGQEATCFSYNFPSWKATFYLNLRKNQSESKFKFKKISETEFKIWRIK